MEKLTQEEKLILCKRVLEIYKGYLNGILFFEYFNEDIEKDVKCYGIHGFCYVFNTITNCRLNLYSWKVCEEELPQLWKHKPKEVYHWGQYWFPVSDIQSRIDILEKVIIDLQTN